MLTTLKRFFKEEEGMGTVEIVIIVAILIGIALLFGKTIKGWVKDQMDKITKTDVNGALSTDGTL